MRDGQMNTAMPWTLYAEMKEEDLGAIYDYLIQVKTIRNRITVFIPK